MTSESNNHHHNPLNNGNSISTPCSLNTCPNLRQSQFSSNPQRPIAAQRPQLLELRRDGGELLRQRAGRVDLLGLVVGGDKAGDVGGGENGEGAVIAHFRGWGEALVGINWGTVVVDDDDGNVGGLCGLMSSSWVFEVVFDFALSVSEQADLLELK
jgi:hypothetical protein